MTCLWSKNLNGQLCELFQAQYSLVILYRRKQIKCGHHHLQSSCIILTGNYSNIPDQMHLKTKQNAVDCYNYLFFNYALKVILLTCTILNFNITISRLNTNRISYNLKKNNRLELTARTSLNTNKVWCPLSRTHNYMYV